MQSFPSHPEVQQRAMKKLLRMSEDQQGRAATLSPCPGVPGPSSFPSWYFLTPVYIPMNIHGFTTCLEQEPGLPPVPLLSLSRQVGGGVAQHPNHFSGPPLACSSWMLDRHPVSATVPLVGHLSGCRFPGIISNVIQPTPGHVCVCSVSAGQIPRCASWEYLTFS